MSIGEEEPYSFGTLFVFDPSAVMVQSSLAKTHVVLIASPHKERTFPMANVLEVTDSTFEDEVKKSPVPVLVDFWAPWCGPCKAIAPIVEELAGDYNGKIKVVKVNTDDNFKTAQEYRISGIPSLLIFKAGEPVEQMVGVHKKANLASMIDKHIG